MPEPASYPVPRIECRTAEKASCVIHAALLAACAAPIVVLGLVLFALALCKEAARGDKEPQKSPTIAPYDPPRHAPLGFPSRNDRCPEDQ